MPISDRSIIDGGVYNIRFSWVLYIIWGDIDTNVPNNRYMRIKRRKSTSILLFFFYTFIGSVFMLLAIFTLYSHAGTTDYQALCCLQFGKELQYFIFLGFF